MTSIRELAASTDPPPDPARDPGAEPAVPETPQQVRDLLCADLAAVSDAQLVALVVATGGRGPRTAGSRSCVAVGAQLLAAAGGLGDLVKKTCADEIDWREHGIGVVAGARVIAAMELADRWRRGLVSSEEAHAGGGDGRGLSQKVFKRQKAATDTERLAILLSKTIPDIESAEKLVSAFESAAELLACFSLEAFEPSYRLNRVFMVLPGTGLEIEHSACCRLLAGVELARRLAGKVALRPLAPGALGLRSSELESLLDPTSPLEPELRQNLVEVLRTHPHMTGDFAKLDRLVADAGTGSYQRAAELHQMFELLRRRRRWAHPAEVLGEPVPYAGLLSIAAARIARARRPPVRILEVQKRLQQAEREAVAEPVTALVEALLAAGISASGAEQALEGAKRGYLARLRNGSRRLEAMAS